MLGQRVSSIQCNRFGIFSTWLFETSIHAEQKADMPTANTDMQAKHGATKDDLLRLPLLLLLLPVRAAHRQPTRRPPQRSTNASNFHPPHNPSPRHMIPAIKACISRLWQWMLIKSKHSSFQSMTFKSLLRINVWNGILKIRNKPIKHYQVTHDTMNLAV